MQCPTCRANVPAQAKFCPVCGSPMSAAATPQAQGQPQAYGQGQPVYQQQAFGQPSITGQLQRIGLGQLKQYLCILALVAAVLSVIPFGKVNVNEDGAQQAASVLSSTTDDINSMESRGHAVVIYNPAHGALGDLTQAMDECSGEITSYNTGGPNASTLNTKSIDSFQRQQIITMIMAIGGAIAAALSFLPVYKRRQKVDVRALGGSGLLVAAGAIQLFTANAANSAIKQGLSALAGQLSEIGYYNASTVMSYAQQNYVSATPLLWLSLLASVALLGLGIYVYSLEAKKRL